MIKNQFTKMCLAFFLAVAFLWTESIASEKIMDVHDFSFITDEAKYNIQIDEEEAKEKARLLWEENPFIEDAVDIENSLYHIKYNQVPMKITQKATLVSIRHGSQPVWLVNTYYFEVCMLQSVTIDAVTGEMLEVYYGYENTYAHQVLAPEYDEMLLWDYNEHAIYQSLFCNQDINRYLPTANETTEAQALETAREEMQKRNIDLTGLQEGIKFNYLPQYGLNNSMRCWNIVYCQEDEEGTLLTLYYVYVKASDGTILEIGRTDYTGDVEPIVTIIE